MSVAVLEPVSGCGRSPGRACHTPRPPSGPTEIVAATGRMTMARTRGTPVTCGDGRWRFNSRRSCGCGRDGGAFSLARVSLGEVGILRTRVVLHRRGRGGSGTRPRPSTSGSAGGHAPKRQSVGPPAFSLSHPTHARRHATLAITVICTRGRVTRGCNRRPYSIRAKRRARRSTRPDSLRPRRSKSIAPADPQALQSPQEQSPSVSFVRFIGRYEIAEPAFGRRAIE